MDVSEFGVFVTDGSGRVVAHNSALTDFSGLDGELELSLVYDTYRSPPAARRCCQAGFRPQVACRVRVPGDDQILAFRLMRAGLGGARAASMAEALTCPASDFARDAALLALTARADGVTREAYDRAVDAGEVVVAHVVRGAIHALAPEDHAVYGRALLGQDERELSAQLGQQVSAVTKAHGISRADALEEAAAATADALAGGAALDKNALHDALRQRVRPELMPWCRGCESHHVLPMLWRFATIRAGVRLDAARRYRLAELGPTPPAARALGGFLRFYGPARPADFAAWAGLSSAHAKRVWTEVTDDLAEVPTDHGTAWLLPEDVPVLESATAPGGVHLLPPGDPVLQKPNRELVAPDPGVRKRLFRPVASPGAVLHDGRLAGLWRSKAKGRRLEVTVEALGPLPYDDLETEARRVAALRGAEEAVVSGLRSPAAHRGTSAR